MTSAAALGSTYRLQLNGLGFAGARASSRTWTARIETLYVSPVLAAAPGSTHGYDVIDPNRLDPALGSPEEFEALLDELAPMACDYCSTSSPTTWPPSAPTGGGGTCSAAVRPRPTPAPSTSTGASTAGACSTPVLSSPVSAAGQETSISEEPDGAVLHMDGLEFPLAPDGGHGGPLSQLLAAQHFRPAFWRLGDTAGNYRRFFNIDGLVGVRVEDREVFARTHGLILALCADERIAGLRVDHIDGLWDPAQYLRRLDEALAARGRSPMVLVEKILDRDESLDERWPVDGTTGYEFADRAGGLFLEETGCRRLSDIGAELTGEGATFEELGLAAKREMLDRTFVAQLDRLTRLALLALDAEHPGHDLSVTDVRRAMAELTVSLDAYRTYLDGVSPSRVDVATISRAVARSTTNGADREVERAAKLVAKGLLEDGPREPLGSTWPDVGSSSPAP